MLKVLYYILSFYYKAETVWMRILPCKNEDSILLMRMDNIGDFILWLSSAKEFRRYYNKKRLVLLCNGASTQIAKQTGLFDEIISVDTQQLFKNPFYRIKFFTLYGKRKFDKIISPAYTREYFSNDLTVRNFKAKEKIGFDGNYYNTISKLRGFSFSLQTSEKISRRLNIKGNRYYTELIPSSGKMMMELGRNAEFIQKLFNTDFRSCLYEVSFELPEIKNLPSRYAVMFIGSSSKVKLWQNEKYAYIINNTDIDFVILGSGKDGVTWQNISKFVDKNKKVVDLTGKTSLTELFSVIKGAEFMLTNDSVASHIAPVVRTKSVVLLPGSHYGRFHPYEVENISNEDKEYLPVVACHFMDCYNCNNICIKSSDKNKSWLCIEGITKEQVMDKINEIRKN